MDPTRLLMPDRGAMQGAVSSWPAQAYAVDVFVMGADPRAGHGPGIGGFKKDSEVGVAQRAGHSMYSVTFRPQPDEGQILSDGMQAEARLMEEVIARHSNATKPVVVFASWGGNITPPPQALNWIIDAWGSELAVAAAGSVIVYGLHESVGHLGIFEGADVARKESDRIVSSLEVVDQLPSGLYEMKVVLKGEGAAEQAVQRWHDLEPGSYTVHFEHRTMDDLRAVNPEGRDEEQTFSTVARLSEINSSVYTTWRQPWLGNAWAQAVLPPVGDAMARLHPLRLQREGFSDMHPAAIPVAQLARHVRAHRHVLADDHPARQSERLFSNWFEDILSQHRDQRDQSDMQWTRAVHGPACLGAWLPPDMPAETVASVRAQGEIEHLHRELLPRSQTQPARTGANRRSAARLPASSGLVASEEFGHVE